MIRNIYYYNPFYADLSYIQLQTRIKCLKHFPGFVYVRKTLYVLWQDNVRGLIGLTALHRAALITAALDQPGVHFAFLVH